MHRKAPPTWLEEEELQGAKTIKERLPNQMPTCLNEAGVLTDLFQDDRKRIKTDKQFRTCKGFLLGLQKL